MVDAERLAERLDRLEVLLERLERVRGRGREAYLADEQARAATERWLQLAIQLCIDLGAQLVSELSLPAPTDYAGVFAALAERGGLEEELAMRLAAAARQRNVLVRLYQEVDDEAVLASLERLDDFRTFAAYARGRQAD